MKRSGGITASAVLAILGSVVAILFAGLMVAGAAMAHLNPIPPPDPSLPVSPIDPSALLVFVSLFYVGFGVWGIVSAVGLLRLRNWARICFAVYGGLLTVFSVFGAIGLFVVSRFAPPAMPPDSNVPAGFLESLFTVFIVIALLFAALGICWMIYFTSLRVKELFLGLELASVPRQFPLTITIIAWILIVGGVAFLLYALLPFPAFFFSFAIHRSAARVLYFLLAIVSLVSGTGMLKKRVEAYALAMAYFGFTLLNSIATFVIPGSQARMQDFFREVSRGQPMPIPMNSIATISIIFAFVMVGLGMGFLIKARRRFIDACSR